MLHHDINKIELISFKFQLIVRIQTNCERFEGNVPIGGVQIVGRAVAQIARCGELDFGQLSEIPFYQNSGNVSPFGRNSGGQMVL